MMHMLNPLASDSFSGVLWTQMSIKKQLLRPVLMSLFVPSVPAKQVSQLVSSRLTICKPYVTVCSYCAS